MANPKHSETDNASRHLPKDFELAGNETALIKDENGSIIYRLLSELGEVGPQGPPGTITEDQERSLNNNSSTGGLSGGLVSINGGDNTKFDISAGQGLIVDSHTDPLNPVPSSIIWTAFTAEDVTNLATNTASFIGLAKGPFNVGTQAFDAVLVQQTTNFTREQLRDIIRVGTLTHVAGTIIEATGQAQIFVANPINQISDLADAIGNINITGNVFSPSGANLALNKSLGETFRFGIGSPTDKKDPNTALNPATVAGTFFLNFQDGAGGTTIVPGATFINPVQWDDGSGVLATVPNNQFTILRIFFTPNGFAIISYGQALYANLSDAEAALNTEVFVKSPGLAGIPLRGWIIVRNNVTDLTAAVVAGTAKFINGGKFDESLAGGASTSTTTQQQAYNNSAEPEILTNDIGGAMTFQDGSIDKKNITEYKKLNGDLAAKVDADGNMLSKNIRTAAPPAAGVITIDYIASDEIRTSTITENSSIVLNNPVIGKTIVLEITGSFTLTFPASTKILNGKYNGAVTNWIMFYCVDGTPEYLVTINQEQ